MKCGRKAIPFSCASAAQPRAARCTQASAVGRRDALASVSVAAATLLAAPSAQAKKKDPNFNTLRDTGDGYELLYPFGWQEVQVQGIDVVFKDIIEPLESCAVQLVPTEKKDINAFGTPNEIAGTLARTVLSADSDEVQLVKSESERSDGKDYVTFEFIQKASRFNRHVLAAATVANGKLMLFTIGASEKRWNKLKDRLLTSVQSFKGFERYSGA